ncbi:hypothetical protein QSI_2692 [Clostridioides difficile P28]|nr:hypothetical protein QSI_2692 [Clostridioides difficile P28]
MNFLNFTLHKQAVSTHYLYRSFLRNNMHNEKNIYYILYVLSE